MQCFKILGVNNVTTGQVAREERRQEVGGVMAAVNTQSGYSNAGDTSAAPHSHCIVTILGPR